MGNEIERKFLVEGDFKSDAIKHFEITQAYLSSNPERTVRIRIKDQKAYITIKGKSNKTGTSRFEWEKEIALKEARELLNICEPGIIKKTRHIIPVGKHIFEVDEFEDDNKGLIMAEVELESENEPFIKPTWLGKEVTGDKKYYNSYLSKKPFNKW